MTQSLRVNQKEYVPSTVLSIQFGYSPDYISKLAREEKILATRIGRTWFVEPESLRQFTLQAKVHKRIRTDQLRQERCAERLRTQQNKPTQKVISPVSVEAVTQTALILLCSFFVGGLSWVVAQQDLHASDLSRGSQEALSIVSEHVLPDIASITHSMQMAGSSRFARVALHSENSATINTSRISNGGQTQSGRYTEFPVSDALRVSANGHATSSVPSVSSSGTTVAQRFSDEVRVVLGVSSSTVMVEPVFRYTTGTPHEFMLIPVNDIDK